MEAGSEQHFVTPFPGDPADPRGSERIREDPGDPGESSRRLDFAVIYNDFGTFCRKVTSIVLANPSDARILSTQCRLCIEKHNVFA